MPNDNYQSLRLRAIPLLKSEAGQTVVSEVCKKDEVAESDFIKLLDAQIAHAKDGNRYRLFESFNEVFGKGDNNVD